MTEIEKRIQKRLEDYWNKSREHETQTINDVDKYTWLANSVGAVISIGYIQAKGAACVPQNYGVWLFVVGAILFLLMKYTSMIISSRDRQRFQTILPEITPYNEEEKMNSIRDNKYGCMKKIYLCLQFGAGLAFIAGCISTLVGVTFVCV